MHLRNTLAKGMDAESYSLHTFEALLSQSMENLGNLWHTELFEFILLFRPFSFCSAITVFFFLIFCDPCIRFLLLIFFLQPFAFWSATDDVCGFLFSINGMFVVFSSINVWHAERAIRHIASCNSFLFSNNVYINVGYKISWHSCFRLIRKVKSDLCDWHRLCFDQTTRRFIDIRYQTTERLSVPGADIYKWLTLASCTWEQTAL